MLVSIVIPIYNEADNIDLLYEKICLALNNVSFSFEVILVDDGSVDPSPGKLQRLALKDERFKSIELSRNFGQTAAMMAGFDHASGDIIVPMDGDLQNDPEDIPGLVDKIDEGYGVCSGWRKDRQDHPIRRNLPSRMANRLISRISGVPLHDYGCTLKAYRKDIIKGIRLYGEMHRFIPIYASRQGAKIAEIPVKHHPRKFGASKIGPGRTIKVILDLIFIKALSSLSNNPIYIFGGFGLLSMAFSALSFGFMLYYKFWGNKSFIETPLPFLAVLFFLVSIISLFMGFIAEIQMRTYYESQGKSIYMIKAVHNLEKRRAEKR
ncbi:MAG: glycosyltransferase family 2 protein [Desulfobacterales bacterium]|nr:glycosyltransferase family 2 protein [Desulfobacterales bacterium]